MNRTEKKHNKFPKINSYNLDKSSIQLSMNNKRNKNDDKNDDNNYMNTYPNQEDYYDQNYYQNYENWDNNNDYNNNEYYYGYNDYDYNYDYNYNYDYKYDYNNYDYYYNDNSSKNKSPLPMKNESKYSSYSKYKEYNRDKDKNSSKNSKALLNNNEKYMNEYNSDDTYPTNDTENMYYNNNYNNNYNYKSNYYSNNDNANSNYKCNNIKKDYINSTIDYNEPSISNNIYKNNLDKNENKMESYNINGNFFFNDIEKDNYYDKKTSHKNDQYSSQINMKDNYYSKEKNNEKKKSKINHQKIQNSQPKLKINFNYYSKIKNNKNNNNENSGIKKIDKLQDKKDSKDIKGTKYRIKPLYEKLIKIERKNNKENIENKDNKDNKNISEYQFTNKISYDAKRNLTDRSENINKSQDFINRNAKIRKNIFSNNTENFHDKYNTNNISSVSRNNIKEKFINKNNKIRENNERKQIICYHSSFMTRRRENKEKSDDLSDIKAIPQKFKNIYKIANNTKLKITINSKKDNLTRITSKTQTIEDIYNRRLMFEKNLLSKKKECDKCHQIIDSHLFIIHYNSHCTEIFDWLYLGTFENACDICELRRLKINYILNVAIECTNKTLPKDIKELHLDIPDYELFELYGYFEEANDFISKCKAEGGHLLVHCKYGISRSTTFVIAYLIKNMRYTTNSALKFIQEKRKRIKPNEGFLEQLYKYEEYYLGKKC